MAEQGQSRAIPEAPITPCSGDGARGRSVDLVAPLPGQQHLLVEQEESGGDGDGEQSPDDA
jgi:hypothetical protein